jgi:kynurenine formamidase
MSSSPEPPAQGGLDVLFGALASATFIQLAQPLSEATPAPPVHAPVRYHLDLRHGEGTIPGADPRISGATDSISMGLHVGTHVDSLSHCGFEGRLHDGTDLSQPGVQAEHVGVRMRSGQGLRPMVARGVLLDFCAWLGTDRLPSDYVITAPRLEACAADREVAIEAGDVVLLRTGWDRLWHEPDRFLGPELPGPDLGAARLLTQRGIQATGSDTLTYECAPGDTPLAVHAELLVHAGIPIMECLKLDELAATGARRFLFVGLPLRLDTATGSPLNPVAVLAA